MNKQGWKRLLSLLLALALVFGFSSPALAAGEPGAELRWRRVERSATAENLRQAELPLQEQLYQDTDVVRVSIVLADRSTVEAGYATADIASNTAAMTYRSELARKQRKVEGLISTQALQGQKLDVVWNLTLAANLISANVEYGRIQEIRKVEGVSEVYLETTYSPDVVSQGEEVGVNMLPSSQMIGSPQVWQAGYTGAGTRIAIIDTGLDEDHPSFSDGALEYALDQIAQEAGMSPADYRESLDMLEQAEIQKVLPKLNAFARLDSLTAEQLYRNAKVAFAFNYKDSDLDITHDHDTQGDHGSHVAGIAAANRYIPEAGGFQAAADTVKMTGVAPDAQLIIMKVFGKSGAPADSDFLAALEDAILLGCDSVNLSLGSNSTGFVSSRTPYFNEIFASLEHTDTVVAISAGNVGSWADSAFNWNHNLYGDDVSYYTVGSPGSYANAFTVASADNNGATGLEFTVNGVPYFYTETSFANEKLATLDTAADHSGTEYAFVLMDGFGETTDYENLDVAGKVVIVSRGNTSFNQKHDAAQAAGAAALVIYNNEAGIINLDLTGGTATIPCVSLPQQAAEELRQGAAAQGAGIYTGRLTVKAGVSVAYTGGPAVMSSFSSWGVPSALIMKPEITAPGGNIYSARNDGTYGLGSGTSMAAPQVAGMAALVAQYIQENRLADGISVRKLATSLLMSTAAPMHEESGAYYSILQQGAGLANVSQAVSSPTYILMDQRADGKVKAELGDDPQRQGVYSFSFTVHNLTEQAQSYILDADTMTQDLFTDYANWMQNEEEVCTYLDKATTDLGAKVSFRVDGQSFENRSILPYDFNGDEVVDELDAQALLERAVDPAFALTHEELADLSGDGKITAHDAQLLLAMLDRQILQVPAGGRAQVEVTLTLPEEIKAALDEKYENGAYVEGFIYLRAMADEEGAAGATHSIPLLGFYGNWSDASMYDVATAEKVIHGTEKRQAYLPTNGAGYENYMTVSYKGAQGEFYFAGNPVQVDEVFLPERNALNNQKGDKLANLVYSNIRNAGNGKLVIANQQTGEVYQEKELGPVESAYYYSDGMTGRWVSDTKQLRVGWGGTDANGRPLPEGTKVSISLILAPEYYANEDGTYRWDELGEGAYLTTYAAIDNTAPEIQNISLSLTGDTLDVTAKDNAYIAMVGLYNGNGTQLLSGATPNQVDAGAAQTVSLDLSNVVGSKFLVQVYDYAMNATTYEIELGPIGTPVDYEFKVFDQISKSWLGFDSASNSTATLSVPNLDIYAATYVEGYVFAITGEGDLYVMKDGALDDYTFVANVGTTIVDMAYNAQDKTIYGIDGKTGWLVAIDKLNGELTQIGLVATPDGTATLACDGAGTFYCLNYNASTDLYAFTLETVGAPTLVGNTGFGMKFMQSIEWNPNDGQIYWTMLDEYWNFSIFGFMKIDPRSAQTEQLKNFTMWGTGLYIPEHGKQDDWYDPVDEVEEMTISAEHLELLVDHSATLRANITPWTVRDRSVTWSSSNSAVATVDADGRVTALRPGTAKITATSNLDPNRSVSCTVTADTLHATLEGVLQNAEGEGQIFTWDLSTAKTWSRVAGIAPTISSATLDTKNQAVYVEDAVDSVWAMHRLDPRTGETLETSGASPLAVPMWDLAYSQHFSTAEAPKIAGVYSNLMWAPMDPMNPESKVFNWSTLLFQTSATKLVALASGGQVPYYDAEQDITVDTELFYLLDNAGYLWMAWLFPVETGYDAYVSYYPTELFGLQYPLFTGYQYCSLVADPATGALFLSYFTGETNQIYFLEFDGERFSTILLGDMGENVWPAALVNVDFHDNGQASDMRTQAGQDAMRITAQTVSAEQLELSGLLQDLASRPAEFQQARGGLHELVQSGTAMNAPIYKDVELNPADRTVKVTVRAPQDTASSMLEFSYDEQLLTLTGVSSPVQLSAVRQEAGGAAFACAAWDSLPAGSALAALTFTYPKGTENLTSEIVVTTTERNDQALEETARIQVKFPCTGGESCPSGAYEDLNADAWYHEYTDYVIEKGIMVGDGKRFTPNAGMTRGMLVQTLYNLSGSPAVTGESGFADVNATKWYAKAVAWAKENGIVLGVSQTRFAPERLITREETVTILYRYLRDYAKADMTGSSDLAGYQDAAQISAYARDAMRWAVAAGLIQGVEETRLAPRGTALRCQMAKLLTILDRDLLQ